MRFTIHKLTPYLDRCRERFAQLPLKDQRALTALTIFLVIFIFWYLVWVPLDQWADREHDQLVIERETQAFLATHYHRARELIKLRDTGPKKEAASVIASSGRLAGLELARVQPARQGVSVWLDEVPYQKLLAWLVQLHNREGLEVRQIRIDKTERHGIVKAFLRLSR